VELIQPDGWSFRPETFRSAPRLAFDWNFTTSYEEEKKVSVAGTFGVRSAGSDDTLLEYVLV